MQTSPLIYRQHEQDYNQARTYWHDLFARGNTLTVGYDGFWQHAFPLNWENIGDKDSKAYVPDQLSHNLSLAYSLKEGRYNLALDAAT